MSFISCGKSGGDKGADDGDGEDEGSAIQRTDPGTLDFYFRIPGFTELFSIKKSTTDKDSVILDSKELKNNKDYKKIYDKLYKENISFNYPDYEKYTGLYSTPEGGVLCFDKSGKRVGPYTDSGIYYARFDEDSITLKFDCKEDLSAYGLPTSVKRGEYLEIDSLPVIEKEGYVFIGWTTYGTSLTTVTDENGKFKELYKLIDKTYYGFSGDILTFYPAYELLRDIPITLNYNDQSYRIETKYVSGLIETEAKDLTGEEAEARIIVGWSFDPEGKEIFDKTKITEPLTLYAVWRSYRYAYVYDGCGNEELIRVIDGEDVKLPTPTKSGYTFVGWFDNPFGSGFPLSDTVSYADGYESYYGIWRATE